MTITNENVPEGFEKFGGHLVCRTCGAHVAEASAGLGIDSPQIHTEWHAKVDPK